MKNRFFLATPTDVTRGGKQPPCLRFLIYVAKTLLIHITCLSILSCIAYYFTVLIFYASQASLLKKALRPLDFKGIFSDFFLSIQ